MKSKKTRCLIMVISATLAVAIESYAATEPPWCEPEVNRILGDGTLKTQQKVDSLTELGPKCLPSMVGRLENTDIGRPSATLIRALGSIRDSRATAALLSRLESLSPTTDADGEYSAEAMLIVYALKDINDPVAVNAIHDVLVSSRFAPETRIAAAHALLFISNGDDYDQSVAYLFSLADLTSQEWEKANGRFDPRQLDRAIAAIGNHASRQVLLSRLEGCGTSHEEMAIVELIGDHVGSEEELALLKIIASDGHEWFVRTSATKVLLRCYVEDPRDELRTRFLATLDAIEGDPIRGDFKEAIEEARLALQENTE